MPRPRSADTRAASARPVVAYKPPSKLDAPAPPSDDVEYKWVRRAILGQDDPTNMSARHREGYVPVKASEHAGEQWPTSGNGEDAVIESGGLVLCKIAKPVSEGKREYFENLTRRMAEGIDNDRMKVADPTMPMTAKRESTTSYGRRPAQFDD